MLLKDATHTFALLVTLGALNTIVGDQGFNNLQFLTRWFQLLILYALIMRDGRVIGLAALVGILVSVMHWLLIALGNRRRPTDAMIVHDIFLYVLLPLVAVARALTTSGFAQTTFVQVLTFVLGYTALLLVHDNIMPQPAYDLPFPTLALAAGMTLAGCLLLVVLRQVEASRTRVAM